MKARQIWDAIPRRFNIHPFGFRVPMAEPVVLEIRSSGLAIIAEVFAPWSEYNQSVTLLLRWLEVVVIAGIVIVLALIINTRGAIASSLLVSEWAPQHLEAAATVIASLALLVGGLLAVWKRRQPFVYGIAEIVFGTFSAFQVSLVLWPEGESSKLLTLASALYVISRGIGNVGDAFSREADIQRLRVDRTKRETVTIEESWPPSILNAPRRRRATVVERVMRVFDRLK